MGKRRRGELGAGRIRGVAAQERERRRGARGWPVHHRIPSLPRMTLHPAASPSPHGPLAGDAARAAAPRTASVVRLIRVAASALALVSLPASLVSD